MAAATTITVNDGQGTPAAHSFIPVRKNGSLVEWEERSTPHTPAGYYILGISGGDTRGSSQIIRSKVSLSVPLEVLDTSTSTYLYSNTARFILDILMPKAMTAAQRADLAAYLKNITANAVVTNLVSNLDAPF